MTQTVTDEYSAIQLVLQQAEEELGKALSNLSLRIPNGDLGKPISDENHNEALQLARSEDNLLITINQCLKDRCNSERKNDVYNYNTTGHRRTKPRKKIEVYFPPPPPLSPPVHREERSISSPILSSDSEKSLNGTLETPVDRNRNKRALSEPPGGKKLESKSADDLSSTGHRHSAPPLSPIFERPTCNILKTQQINRAKRPSSLDIISHMDIIKKTADRENVQITPQSANAKLETTPKMDKDKNGSNEITANNKVVVSTSKKISRATQTKGNKIESSSLKKGTPRTPLSVVEEVEDMLSNEDLHLATTNQNGDLSQGEGHPQGHKSANIETCHQQIVQADVHVSATNTSVCTETKNTADLANISSQNVPSIHTKTNGTHESNSLSTGNTSPLVISNPTALDVSPPAVGEKTMKPPLIKLPLDGTVENTVNGEHVFDEVPNENGDSSDENTQAPPLPPRNYKLPETTPSSKNGKMLKNGSIKSKDKSDQSDKKDDDLPKLYKPKKIQSGKMLTTPEGSGGSLLDTMHKKYYAHQYMRAKSDEGISSKQVSFNMASLKNNPQVTTPERQKPALGISGKTGQKHNPSLHSIKEQTGGVVMRTPSSERRVVHVIQNQVITPNKDEYTSMVTSLLTGTDLESKQQKDTANQNARSDDEDSYASSQYSTSHIDSKTRSVSPTSIDSSLSSPGIQRRVVEETVSENEGTLKAKKTSTMPQKGLTSILRNSSQKKAHTLPGAGSNAQFRKSFQQYKSERENAEIEAVEACKWLRAAGFPQYAQMYEDLQFPVNVDAVEQDHDFLDRDSIQSLFRRLNTLNKCASMKIETPPRQTIDESDDDEQQCALSDKWKYQRSSRRWSRKDSDSGSPTKMTPNIEKKTIGSCSSHDSVLTDNDSASQQGDSPVLHTKETHRPTDLVFSESPSSAGYHTLSPELRNKDGGIQSQSSDTDTSPSQTSSLSPRLRRAASEKIKGAKHFLNKKMDSLKTKKRRRVIRDGALISGPVLIDSPEMQERMQRLGCVDISPTSEGSPLLRVRQTEEPTTPLSSDSDTSPMLKNKLHSVESGNESGTTTYSGTTTTESYNTSTLNSPKDSHTGSQSDIPLEEEMYIVPPDYKPGTFPKIISNGYINTGTGSSLNCRTGSFNLGSESNTYRDTLLRENPTRRHHDDSQLDPCRMSIYDNVHLIANDSGLTPQEELDMILNNLFEDINGLNRSLSETLLVTQNGLSTSQVDVEENASQNLNSSTETMETTHQDVIAEHENDADGEQEHASGVSSTVELSDQDTAPETREEISDNAVFRERRDSGVGSSLTRAPSDRRRPRIRWHSFQKSHRPSLNSRTLQISNLSAGQLMVLRKLSLLKITALMERYSPTNRTGWNWVVPKFIKRFKAPDYKDKNVFGIPLLVVLQRTGQPLPQCILYAMRHLRRTATDAVGIFRKSGVRSRIQKLRNHIEANPDLMNYDSLQAYDVADLLKQYFRELPECLLTNKLSETFISIYQHVPNELRLEALQAAIIMMPDENREVLQSLLLFLSDMAQHSEENQMTASNLAVCFAPSLFHMCGMRNNHQAGTHSPKRNTGGKNLGIPDQKELLEQKAAHECLTQMILESKKIFMIPEDTMMKCKFSYMEQGDPVTLDDLGAQGVSNSAALMDSCIQGILKESRDKFKGWDVVSSSDHVDLAYKKVGDGHPLRLWKAAVDVEAPPIEVLNRILRERHLWDDDLLKWRVVEKIDKETEVFQYVENSMAPHPTRDFCELRSWRTDLPKGACVLVSTSVEHSEATLLGGVRAVALASRYLIEPCGSGKARLTHICRIDTRGRSPEWYNKAYGHICASYVARIRDSFKQNATVEGPETKV